MTKFTKRRLGAGLVTALAVVTLAPAAIAAPGSHDHPPGAPAGLEVSGQQNPLAVQGTPQFSWLPQDIDPDEAQSAYQLRVSTPGGATVWDSGRVASSAQSWVSYTGPALQPGTTYVWAVRTWDRDGQESPYATGRFDTGLGDGDWSGAQWIRRTTSGNDASNDYTLARRTLDVPAGSPVVRARAYVAAMGDWELQVDGRTVDKTSSPGYPGEGYYDVSDLTALANAGQPLTVGVLYHYWTCTCQGRANGPVAPEGPSGLLVKVVVDHADGTTDMLVSDGSWKVTEDAAEQTTTLTYRNSDAGDRVEYVDARAALTGWDTPGYDDSTWASPAVIGPHPRPAAASCASYKGGSSPCTFTHLVAEQAHLATQVIHPVSVLRLPDGTVFADFGAVNAAVPSLRLADGVAGRALTLTTSYREANTTTASAVAAGATTVPLASVGNLHVGDRITVDAPADGYGAGHPETHTVAAIDGTTATLDGPLARAHEVGVWVENSRAGTSKLDTQGSNMRFFYTERDGAQTAQPFTYWGWRYLEISDPGETLTRDDISAVVQNTGVGQPATFRSDNSTLDAVFDLMQHSALQSAQDTFLDTPTREKGQFLGDSVDESFATMSSLDERLLTRQAIVDFIGSQQRYWSNGAMNAVYPNGDAKRDIPDYSEMFPEWVMEYYRQTGDSALLAQALPAMRNVADYVNAAVNQTGLVYQLPGGSGAYSHGIIDWPAPMRYDTVVDGNGAELVVNALAVGANRAVADAGAALGQDTSRYGQHADTLAAAVRSALRNSTTGLYSDGLDATSLAPIANYSQHAQTYAVDYGIAPSSDYAALGAAISAAGMKQGPMDLRQLEDALGRTGQTAALVRLLTDPNHDGPAQVLAEGGTFMWEQWTPGCSVPSCTGTAVSQSANDSFSHGWGSAGIVGIQQSLLGVTVAAPGAASLRIAPPTSGLTRASGSEWTERGSVSVDWHHAGGVFAIDVSLPVNVTATVVLGGHEFTVGSGHTHLSVKA
ncbi:MAG TPA: alpha-L-rhamnosidase N-terminal domain-containing protein [Jatrophihabitantaceae bacterium]